MTRPKATFRLAGTKGSKGQKAEPGKMRRRPQPLGVWAGQHFSLDDKDLPEALQEILADERAIRSVKKSCGQNIRHTLKQLQRLVESELRQAILDMDEFTQARLETGALRWHRCRLGQDGELPPNWMDIEQYPDHEIMEIIDLAIASMPKTGGRDSTVNRDVEFSVRLAEYWNQTNGKRPTATSQSEYAKNSRFIAFALDCFARVGRKIRAGTLRKIYQGRTGHEQSKPGEKLTLSEGCAKAENLGDRTSGKASWADSIL